MPSVTAEVIANLENYKRQVWPGGVVPGQIERIDTSSQLAQLVLLREKVAAIHAIHPTDQLENLADALDVAAQNLLAPMWKVTE